MAPQHSPAGSEASIRIPQVLITLAPDGSLQAELPGANGARRLVPLRASEIHATLTRILHAQLGNRIEIGTDGAPTARQIRHWEKHRIFRDPQCPFCVIEIEAARIARQAAETPKIRNQSVTRHTISEAGGVTIRRIEGKRSAALRSAGVKAKRTVPEGSVSQNSDLDLSF